MNIRLFKPSIGEEELNNIKKVFERQWLGLGPMVAEFEIEWSKYIGCNTSIAVNSATAALHLALKAFHFKKGKKVLVPAITFASTATAVLYNELVPVFVDVDERSVSIDFEDMDKKYDKDVVAVIPVHNGGVPVEMDKLIEWANWRKIKVIEDCAHAAGSTYKGKKLGTWGNIGCFSFEEKKLMTTGDGGMICSDDTELIEPLRPYRWVGIDKDTWRRTENFSENKKIDAMHWHYEISVLGYKYNMNDIAAAIGLAQLKKLDKMNKKRSIIIDYYLKGISDLKTIQPIFPYQPDIYPYWFFGIRTKKRDDLIIFLKQKGISTGVHFYPLPLHPLFRKYNADCPRAEKIWKEFITLPSHIELNEEELDYIINALHQFEANYA